MTSYIRTAGFEDFGGHRAPVLRWRPTGVTRAQAVFFPPFGDEMNQSRRMFRLAAEALAQRQIGSCVFDLLGTGDSSAGFEQATVEDWLSDCRAVLDSLGLANREPVVLIGCRLGVALAAVASGSLVSPAALLVGWAPLLQGRQQLNGLLRAARIARASRPDAPDPKVLWAAGENARLAGYPVSPILAEQLESLDATRAPQVDRATLFELRTIVDETSPAVTEGLSRRAADWTGQGVPTDAIALEGPAFWNVADLVDVPALIDATVQTVDATLTARALPSS